MNKKMVLVFVFVSLISLTAVNGVKSQTADAIFINADGSVLGTSKIQRDGNLYRLTDNIYNSPIVVQCNDIVLDGRGFTLQGASGWVSGLDAINLTCSNVTVQNFNIIGFWEVGVLGAYNSNVIFNNSITNTDRATSIYADNYNVTGNYLANNHIGVRIKGNNNSIFENQILDNADGFFITNSTGNMITANNIENNGIAVHTDYGGFQVHHNNFVNQNRDFNGGWYTHILLTAYDALNQTWVMMPSWDNGEEGNYWSDYASRYSNATEIDNSGIGNIPYIISSSPHVVDRYPLTAPYNLSEITIGSPSSPTSSPKPRTSPTPNPTAESPLSPSPSPSLSQSSTASPNPTQASTQEMLYGIAVAIVIVVMAVVVLFLRKMPKKRTLSVH